MRITLDFMSPTQLTRKSHYSSNTNEGSHWSAELHNPAANTSEPNATEDTVFNFLSGQWPGLTRATFNTATNPNFYPQTSFANFSLRGQQMYGEMRFICSGLMITGALHDAGIASFGYQCVFSFFPSFTIIVETIVIAGTTRSWARTMPPSCRCSTTLEKCLTRSIKLWRRRCARIGRALRRMVSRKPLGRRRGRCVPQLLP